MSDDEYYLPFEDQQLVIVTTTDEVEFAETETYLLRNKDRLFRKNTKALIIGGVHGDKSGAVGPPDPGLVKDNEGLIELLNIELKEEIKERNISRTLVST